MLRCAPTGLQAATLLPNTTMPQQSLWITIAVLLQLREAHTTHASQPNIHNSYNLNKPKQKLQLRCLNATHPTSHNLPTSRESGRPCFVVFKSLYFND